MILEHHAAKFVPLANGCWIWTAAINNARRPMVGVADNKVALVSRLVCSETYGPPPSPKHQAAHATPNGCFGDLCVAPHHLRWATNRENQADIPAVRRSERSRLGAESKTSESRSRMRKERHEALMAGEAVYYPSKPCKRGHMGPNRVKGDCIQCVNIRNASRDRR
jgi:hypothetical protein